MSNRLNPHTALELTVAKLLFDTFQKSINVHPDTLKFHSAYCAHWDHLENRMRQAWLDTARSVTTVLV